MPTYAYQDSAALTRIAPSLIQAATLNDPIFDIFPIRNRNAAKLRWAVKDNMKGLMQLRGLGGEPTRVARIGDNIYETNPGAYGEFQTIDEVEMTNRAAGFPQGVEVPIDVQDLVAESQEYLTVRQTNRMKQIAWALAVSNTFSVTLPGGGVGHSDTYTGQTVTVSPLWSNTAGAFPLKNLRDLQGTFGFGTSNQFGGLSKAYMNSVTANYLLANYNANDLGRERTMMGATVNDLPGLNRILLSQNAPQIVIWDDGYIDDSNVFQLYLPTGKVLVVGARPNGETPGEFQITRNANNPDVGPQPYAFVQDQTSGPAQSVPPRINVHQGFNGGPVMERPTQLITMTVG